MRMNVLLKIDVSNPKRFCWATCPPSFFGSRREARYFPNFYPQPKGWGKFSYYMSYGKRLTPSFPAPKQVRDFHFVPTLIRKISALFSSHTGLYKGFHSIIRLLAFGFLAFNFSFAQTITNVQARQEGLEIIISYDIEGELHGIDEIMLGISTDGGRTYKTLPNAEGDIGKHVKPGRNKEIYFLVDDALGRKNAKFKVGTISDFTPPGMVYVAGGTFQMGSNKYSDEKPIHTVTISSFFMDKTEVTQGQYRKVMGKNPSYFSGCDDCPVEKVTWHDANVYAKKVGKRLPTEAEWEYAARGGVETNGSSSQTKYAGSNNIKDVAWYEGNSGSKTHPVGQKDPNELGLYDMSGNVWEWCSDWYDSGYYKNSPKNNPKGPNSGTDRVLRGGSWHYYDFACQYYRIMPITEQNLPKYQKLYDMFQQDSAMFVNSPDADFYRGKVAEYEDYLAQKEKAIQQQALQSQKNLDKVMGIQKNTGVAYRYGDDPDYRFNDLGFRLVHSQDSFPLE